MKRYLIAIEETRTGSPASLPDLEGCVSTGLTRDEVEANMREATALRLEGLRLESIPAPVPHAYSTCVEIPF